MSQHRLSLLGLLLAYCVITIAYGVVNPLFEAPDEHYHYFTVQFMADERRLPVAQTPETAVYIEQEAAQPPLYYWLGSWLIRSIDTSESRDLLWLNPRVQMGDASSLTNLNRVVHDPAIESFPWSGYVLAAHVLRLFSTLFGLGTLIALYMAVRTVWPDAPRRALYAVALVAFLPQFNFLHSYINNDVAIIFFATLTLLLLLKVWISAETIPSYPRLMLIGLCVGLAMLSKTAGLLLLVYSTGFVFATGVIKGWTLVRSLRSATVVGLSALSLAGWLLWRNWTLYGDISAANQFVAIAGGDEGFTLLEIFGQSSGIWRSLLAVFGWFNVVPPVWLYAAWTGLVVVLLAGALVSAWSEKPGWLAPLLLGWLLIVYAGMVAFMLRTPAAQGRLLLPALLVLVLPLALGVDWWVKRLKDKALVMLTPLPLLTLFCLFAVIRPAYTRPQAVTNIPDSAAQHDVPLVDNLLLKASNLWITPYLPGDNVPLSLYWESTGPIDEAHEIVVEVFGRNNTPIGKLQTFHGGGLYPTNLWSDDDSLASEIGVRLNSTVAAPTRARVNVRVVGAGQGVDIGYIEVEPESWPLVADDVQPLVRLGDNIELLDVAMSQTELQAGDSLRVDVTWRTTAEVGRFLTTLLHIGPVNEAPLAQGDSAPIAGDYPTSYWQAGEVIQDSYTIVLPSEMPSGVFPLRIGMYDESIVRVLLSAETGVNLDQTYTIGEIEIVDAD